MYIIKEKLCTAHVITNLKTCYSFDISGEKKVV